MNPDYGDEYSDLRLRLANEALETAQRLDRAHPGAAACMYAIAARAYRNDGQHAWASSSARSGDRCLQAAAARGEDTRVVASKNWDRFAGYDRSLLDAYYLAQSQSFENTAYAPQNDVERRQILQIGETLLAACSTVSIMGSVRLLSTLGDLYRSAKQFDRSVSCLRRAYDLTHSTMEDVARQFRVPSQELQDRAWSASLQAWHAYLLGLSLFESQYPQLRSEVTAQYLQEAVDYYSHANEPAHREHLAHALVLLCYSYVQPDQRLTAATQAYDFHFRNQLPNIHQVATAVGELGMECAPLASARAKSTARATARWLLDRFPPLVGVSWCPETADWMAEGAVLILQKAGLTDEVLEAATVVCEHFHRCQDTQQIRVTLGRVAHVGAAPVDGKPADREAVVRHFAAWLLDRSTWLADDPATRDLAFHAASRALDLYRVTGLYTDAIALADDLREWPWIAAHADFPHAVCEFRDTLVAYRQCEQSVADADQSEAAGCWAEARAHLEAALEAAASLGEQERANGLRDRIGRNRLCDPQQLPAHAQTLRQSTDADDFTAADHLVEQIAAAQPANPAVDALRQQVELARRQAGLQHLADAQAALACQQADQARTALAQALELAEDQLPADEVRGVRQSLAELDVGILIDRAQKHAQNGSWEEATRLVDEALGNADLSPPQQNELEQLQARIQQKLKLRGEQVREQLKMALDAGDYARAYRLHQAGVAEGLEWELRRQKKTILRALEYQEMLAHAEQCLAGARYREAHDACAPILHECLLPPLREQALQLLKRIESQTTSAAVREAQAHVKQASAQLAAGDSRTAEEHLKQVRETERAKSLPGETAQQLKQLEQQRRRVQPSEELALAQQAFGQRKFCKAIKHAESVCSLSPTGEQQQQAQVLRQQALEKLSVASGAYYRRYALWATVLGQLAGFLTFLVTWRMFGLPFVVAVSFDIGVLNAVTGWGQLLSCGTLTAHNGGQHLLALALGNTAFLLTAAVLRGLADWRWGAVMLAAPVGIAVWAITEHPLQQLCPAVEVAHAPRRELQPQVPPILRDTPPGS